MNKKPIRKTQKQLLIENADLRARLDEAEEILSAIRTGEVDALVVSGERDVQIFTLKQAEDALAESEGKFRKVVESLPLVVYLNGIGDLGKTIYISPQISAHLGYTPQEWLADPQLWSKLIHADDFQPVMKAAIDTNQRSETFDMEYRMTTRDGRLVWVRDQSLLVYDLAGKPKFRQGIVVDITARKQAEAELQQSQAQLAEAMKIARLCTWEYDAIREENIFNDQFYALVHTTAEQEGGYSMSLARYTERFGYPEDLVGVSMEMQKAFDTTDPNYQGQMEHRIMRAHGEAGYFTVHIRIEKDADGRTVKIRGVNQDITERKRAESELHQSEEFFRLLVEGMKDAAILMLDPKGYIVTWNSGARQIKGYEAKEIIGQHFSRFYTDDDVNSGKPEHGLNIALKNGQFSEEGLRVRKDGSHFTADVTITPLYDKAGELRGFVKLTRDITVRKQAEQKLQESERRFRALVENNSDAITLLDERGIALYDSPAAPGMLGYGSEDLIGQDVFALIHPDDSPGMRDLFDRLVKTPGARDHSTFRLRHKSGSWLWIEMVTTNLLAEPGINAIVLNYHNITERKQAEQRIRRQVDYLTALQDIDRTIASSFDMQTSLKVLISKALTLLKVDAAAVLLMNLSLGSLEFVVGDGFRTNSFETDTIKLAESYAGRAVMKRHMVKIPNLKDDAGNLPIANFLIGEDFVGYYAVPLMLNGKVIGVLEVLQRSLIVRNQEWFDFLNALAGQAAIAISNAQLFDNLQHSNSELAQAYDATIEGWSAALDLRDEETEGHSLRVTEMTMDVARNFGLSEDELVQVRWGSLLHDIGKMGVPDGILLKPGGLTEEEWVLMKKHPRFAYDLLSPIRHLRLALDIPYCHHEKWDGTGYPRGLKGEQIPLAARIFAIVDVWDALRSDRPYRAAWPEEKVRDHITALSGTHFDPQVVDVFMQMQIKLSRSGINRHAPLLES